VLWSYGPIILFSWVETATEHFGAPEYVQDTAKIVSVSWVILIIVRLVHASLRVPGKRTPWDIRSGTMVRYRRGR
jgi:hypothetical protein